MVVVPQVSAAIAEFLTGRHPTPGWKSARDRVPELLLDHANCELKAASTALGFLYRYPERAALAQRMSRLAREELRHFEQVRAIMEDLGVSFDRMSASRYAGSLRDAVRDEEPHKLMDLLLIGALIEARSCERFAQNRAAAAREARANSTPVCWRPKRGILNTTSPLRSRSAALTRLNSMLAWRS